MIRLIAEPHTDTFQVFEVLKAGKLTQMGQFLGVISREEVVELFHEIQLKASFDGEHEDRVRMFLRAKRKQTTLFLEAIESVK